MPFVFWNRKIQKYTSSMWIFLKVIKGQVPLEVKVELGTSNTFPGHTLVFRSIPGTFIFTTYKKKCKKKTIHNWKLFCSCLTFEICVPSLLTINPSLVSIRSLYFLEVAQWIAITISCIIYLLYGVLDRHYPWQDTSGVSI